jgi:hypothetical protein
MIALTNIVNYYQERSGGPYIKIASGDSWKILNDMSTQGRKHTTKKKPRKRIFTGAHSSSNDAHRTAHAFLNGIVHTVLTGLTTKKKLDATERTPYKFRRPWRILYVDFEGGRPTGEKYPSPRGVGITEICSEDVNDMAITILTHVTTDGTHQHGRFQLKAERRLLF